MATYPDITQAVGVVFKFCAQPIEAHKTAAKRIFQENQRPGTKLSTAKMENQSLDFLMQIGGW